MRNQSALTLVVIGSMLILAVESKNLDPYKVLGVERNANQRDIQKAFHKLSLQYHPDKNKNKGAQEKFAEINNAYDILSDEQKRKNYDLYGDEKGSPGFDPGAQDGYSYSTGGGTGESGFSFRPGEWQNMGGHGSEQSFSFSFGGPGSRTKTSYGFGLDDIFSNFFGGAMGGESQFGGFSSSGRSKYKSTGFKSIPSVSSQFYRKEIIDKGMTWLLLFYTPNSQGIQYYESIIEEATSTLKGAVKVGSINCESDASLCKELGAHPRRGPRIFGYSYTSKETGSLVEYGGDLDGKSLKSFCQDNLPRLSKRVNLESLNFALDDGRLPKVLLLSSKKSTPAIWHALSGLYRKRFIFYDAEVHDVSDPSAKKLGIDSLPAIIGWLPNGEKRVLKSGISVKDLKSAIEDLSGLLDNFEKMSKKAASTKNEEHKFEGKGIPLLAPSNFDDICGDKVPVCLIGVFRSSKTREKLEKILLSVSQKSFSRRQRWSSRSIDSVSYTLLDASRHQSFLNALSKSGFKSSDKLLVAIKPKRGTYAAWEGDVTEEAAEVFVSSILTGDLQFTKARQKLSVR